MKTPSFVAALMILLGSLSNLFAFTVADLTTNHTVRVLTQSAYLPGLPVLVRVEVRNRTGKPDRALWDSEAILSADNGVTLSSNRVVLKNGLGSVLVAFSSATSFNLTTTVGALSATNRFFSVADNTPIFVGGTLSSNTTWTGVVVVTNDLTVPAGITLNILSNTLVLLEGAASGTVGNDLLINGSIQCLGTETHPVTITCRSTNLAMRWGQIRHNNAQPSFYRHTTITRAGRAPGEGHTGTAPILRPTGSTIVFEYCNITDHTEQVARGAAGYGTPGKIGMSSGSSLTFNDCLFQRSRMGPEVASTAFICSNTWILDMRGPDDADGVYVHSQTTGQLVKFAQCVLADGDDDGLDTLGSVVNVEDCILRGWNNLFEDAKAISVFGGGTAVRRSLIVDSTVGIAAKWSSGAPTIVTIQNSTLHGNLTNVWANKKSNALGPYVDFRITNSILWGTAAPVISDFGQTNFTIGYSTLSAPWPGDSNDGAAPVFRDAGAHDFQLLPFSPCIDSGAPSSPPDADGSPADRGCFTFVAPAPMLAAQAPAVLAISGYTNRNYILESATLLPNWSAIATNFQAAAVVTYTNAAPLPQQFFRVRVIE